MIQIESFVCVNLLMNMSLLVSGARLAGGVRWGRALIAALTGAAYAVIAGLLGEGWTAGGAQILMLAGMTAIIFPAWKAWVKGFICMAGCAAFMAGCQTMIVRWFPLHGGAAQAVTACAAAAVSFADGWGIRAERERVRVVLRIRTKAGETDMCALVDTGNTLREAMTGLPVIVAEEKRMAACISGEESAPFGEVRKIRYETLGGGGEMKIIKPESVFICEKGYWSRCLDSWIALYPGELPGSIGALAPPGLIGPEGRGFRARRKSRSDGR